MMESELAGSGCTHWDWLVGVDLVLTVNLGSVPVQVYNRRHKVLNSIGSNTAVFFFF